MMQAAREELRLEAPHTVVVGDTMETDILGGVQLGYRTILVLSGGTCREDLARFAYGPDKVVASVAELNVPELAQQFAELAPDRTSSNGPVRHDPPLAETAV
jgi:NagD protein